MLEQDVVSVHAQQCYVEHHAPAIYIMPYRVHVLKLSLAARSAPSQLCLQDNTCSGCSYMMEYYTQQVQQGVSEASPPAFICIILQSTHLP